jgi:hypothetical protein
MLNKIVETLKQLTTTENVVVGGAVNPECIVFAEKYYESLSDKQYDEKLQEIAHKILISITGKFEVIESCCVNNSIMCIISGDVVCLNIEQIQSILGFEDIERELFFKTFESLEQIEKDRFIHNILAVDKIKELLIKPFTYKCV